MSTVRVGILGTASITRSFMGTPLHQATFAAVASRSASRAASFAKQYAIPTSYGSYEALLADPSIDAVYIPLPPSLHAPWVIRAAEAGKHVLVEKPAAPRPEDVCAMAEACLKHKVIYMEAFMYRFKAIHRRVRDILKKGTLGELRYIDFNWSFNIDVLKRSMFRLDPAAGGGALNDLGVYGVDFLRFLGCPLPTVEHATLQRDPPEGVDVFSHVVLRTGTALMALTCGFTCDANYYTLAGERGSVFVPGSLSGRFAPNELHIHLFENDRREEEVFAAENPYAAELEAFAGCILHGTRPESDVEGSLANLRILEEVRLAALR